MRKIEMDLVGTSQATTYRFRERGELPAWACCTVNDETGELTVQSDWGSWTHRWSANPKHLGAPTLTHFLAGCNDANDADYVARKLNREGKNEERFSPELTANAIKGRLLEKRREDAAIYGADCHEHSGSPERHRYVKPLGRDAAREIWNELDDLVADSGHTEVDGTLFFERMPHEIHKYLEELWDAWRGEIRPECVVLREAILPALFAACRVEIEKRRAAEVVVSMQAGVEIPS